MKTVRLVVAMMLTTSVVAASGLAQPVLITSPQTINPGATTITPTAGGTPVPLATAEITVRGTTLTINGRHTIGGLRLEAGPSTLKPAIVTHDANFSFDYSGGNLTDVVNGVHLNVVNDVFIDPLSSIDVTGKGFPSNQGPGAGANAPGNGGANCAASGGGHGGKGGGATLSGSGGGSVAGGITYGSDTQPTTFGSGGGQACGGGGAGGGAIRIQANSVIVEGFVRADGQAPPTDGYPGGGGAGGSIWIQSGLLAGRGMVFAAGGNCSYDQFATFIGPSGPSSRISGAGGGGRIRLEACYSSLYNRSTIAGEVFRVDYDSNRWFRGNGDFQVGGTISNQIGTAIPPLRAGRNLCIGDSSTIPLSSAPIANTSIQWLKDGVPLANSDRISGATSESLSIQNAQPEDAGLYEPRLAGSCGTFVLPGSLVSVGVPMVSRVSAATLPLGLVAAASAYDRARNRIVLVGGLSAPSTYTSDTWEFDGTSWSKAAIPPFPFATAGSAMTYDEDRHTLILVGGMGLPGLWEWDGSPAGWQSKAILGTIGLASLAWFEPAAAYDPVRKVTVIHGGYYDFWGRTGPQTDFYGRPFMWEWNGTTATPISYGLNSPAAPTNAPEGRVGARMVFDRARGQLLLFGGMTDEGASNDLWTWNGTVWNRLASEGPQGRWLHGLVYDEARERVVVMSGTDRSLAFGDIWEWDGVKWTRVLGTAAPIVGPMSASVVYFPDTRTTYSLGGASAGQQSQIRTYSPGSPWITSNPAGVVGCLGGSANVAVRIAPQQDVTFQWYRNGVAVQNGLGGAAPGGGLVSNSSGTAPPDGNIVLHISNANANDVGTFTAVLTTTCGSVGTAPTALTLQTCCPGDLNADTIVDDADFVIFAEAYNLLDCADPAMPMGCPADLNADLVVDDADFVLFASAYDALLCP